MGTQTINSAAGGEGGRQAMRRVLRDLEAMEHMIDTGRFETGRRRIGVEQELVLIDRAMQPAPVAVEVLDELDDPRIVPEIARFNLEYNCDPVELDGSALQNLESQLRELYGTVDTACRAAGARALLAGICPTIDLTHVRAANIMPNPRYAALDESIKRLRGDDYELRIDGADELIVRHPSVMLEAVNTSFQVHLQVAPDEFAEMYNVALAVAAPVLAAAVYSPVLFGKRLWRETRIAIFQQVVDTRSEGAGRRDLMGRVRFGEAWVETSVLEVLRSDVARFRQILHDNPDDAPDPIAQLDRGEVPKLSAWQAFNSSVYRWMRPCYGLTGGRPHLRIENRVLPAGPTITDEVANAAFWIGLMLAGPRRWPDISRRMELRDARGNFLRAARDGLTSHISWLDGEEHPIRELILREFIPAAREGLASAGVAAVDADAAIQVIQDRVTSHRTGAHWMLRSAAKMRGMRSREIRLASLTKAMLANQDSDRPVHLWPDAAVPDGESHAHEFARVAQCMTTDLFTVAQDDCIDLVASIMDWERVRHIPVEDSGHKLVGIISYRRLLRALAHGPSRGDSTEIAVADIMEPDPITVSPDTPTLEAIRLMCEHKVACLPVVESGRLVGIVSDRDYTELARALLERELRGEAEE